MARKNAYGKYILSAGEVASYVVCPEAWRLNCRSDVDPILSPSVREGTRLHEEWTQSLKEAMYFTSRVRVLLMLIIITVTVFCICFFSGN